MMEMNGIFLEDVWQHQIIVVIGAHGNDDDGYLSGCAYIFEKNVITGEWDVLVEPWRCKLHPILQLMGKKCVV